MRRAAMSMALATILEGCAYLTPPLEQPVIEEKLNPAFGERGLVGTLSLTPERRIVLVNFDTKRFCAEAPTEVGVDLASLRKFSAEVAKADQASIGAQMLATVAAQNNVLNRRSQGMMLFLASGYYGCQMYMNKAIGEEELQSVMKQSMEDAKEIILKEIEYLYKDPAARALAENIGMDGDRRDLDKLRREEMERIRKCEADNPGITCLKKGAQDNAANTSGGEAPAAAPASK